MSETTLKLCEAPDCDNLVDPAIGPKLKLPNSDTKHYLCSVVCMTRWIQANGAKVINACSGSRDV